MIGKEKWKVFNASTNLFLSENIDRLRDQVDLIFTSPPYKPKDGFSWEMMHEVFYYAYQVLKPGAMCFVNFGHLISTGKSTPFELAIMMKKMGYIWHDTIVWKKIQYTPLVGNNLNNIWEPIFLMTKGKCEKMDRLSIGKPYADKSNIDRYGKGIDLTCAGNVWEVGYETLTKNSIKLHPDRFPVELPSRGIKLSALPQQSIVMDLFSGSGTTGVACANLNMKYIGIEIKSDHCARSRVRLKQAYKQQVNLKADACNYDQVQLDLFAYTA